MTPQAFRAQVASGATDPVYLIVGDDDHEKSALAVALGEMIEEDLRAFNVERMYAVDAAVTPIVVAEAARTLPMIAPRRVVIVLQAEKLFDPKKKRKAAESVSDDDEAAGSLEPLVDYLADAIADDGAGLRVLEPRGRQEPGGHPAGEEPEGHQGAREGRDHRGVHGSRRREGSGVVGSSSRLPPRDCPWTAR